MDSLRNTGSVEIVHKATALLLCAHSLPPRLSLFDIKLCDKRKLYSLLLSWFRILFFAHSSHFGWFAIHSWVACNGCVQLWSTYLLVLHSFSWTDQKSGADSLHIGPKSRRRFVGVPKPLKVFEHTCEHAGKFITVKHKTAQTINFLVGWWCVYQCSLRFFVNRSNGSNPHHWLDAL